jgi:hypothetical protein
MLHRDSAASHLHSLAFEDHHLVRTTNFDWESVSRNLDGEETKEDMISIADASAAISILLGAICDSRKTHHPVNLASVGAKAESLRWILDSNQSRYKNLASIANEAGMSRAGLSKWLLKLKDEVGLFLSAGKLGGSRQTYARAQKAALAAGCHSSHRRRSRAAKPE